MSFVRKIREDLVSLCVKIGFHTPHKDIRKFVCAVYVFMHTMALHTDEAAL